jgi:hypothetical protein
MRYIILLLLLASIAAAEPVAQHALFLPKPTWGQCEGMNLSVDSGMHYSCIWRSRWGLVGAGHAARLHDGAVASYDRNHWHFTHLRGKSSSPDVALWEFWPGADMSDLQLLDLSTSIPVVGDRLTVWKYNEDTWKIEPRILTVVRLTPGVIWCAQGSIQSGDSGAPALDSAGQVVGMVQGSDANVVTLVDGPSISQIITTPFPVTAIGGHHARRHHHQ